MLLRFMAENNGRVLTRGELLERVWGIDARGLDTRAVDMLVARVRGKLGDTGSEAIATVPDWLQDDLAINLNRVFVTHQTAVAEAILVEPEP